MKHIEFDIVVKDAGFFVWLLRTFGKQKTRYWWRLFGFNVRENYVPPNMMDTVRRCRNEDPAKRQIPLPARNR
mgnify:CR=1 FL=1